ncbi:MAG: M28 family peptidase, partial [Phycisphaerae bacterium]|nr:M28 family peptidase [Phycisphaerae bacterium]
PAFPSEGGGGGGDEGGGSETAFTSYRQPFPFGSTISLASSSFAVTKPTPENLEMGKDFTVLGFSGSGEATGPLVFVGYGLNIGRDGYASYPANTDLTGKIAVVLRFEPMTEEGTSRWDDRGWSFNAALEPKIQQAVKRGAAGVILVNPPGANDERTGRLETIDSTKPAGKPVDVPVVMLSIDRADRLVRAADPAGRSLMDLRRLADDVALVAEHGSVADLPGVNVTLKTSLVSEPIITSNVGGILPGTGDLADQYLVIGAHYDHIGYGTGGSLGGAGSRGRVHPGADDNASGTSGMLMVAEKMTAAYASMPDDQPRRSILFMGFTAEESGLIGSRHYTRNMIADKDRHALMINMDMIGRYRGDDPKQPPLELGGVGTADGLLDFIQPLIDSSGLRVAPKPGGYGPSDHASFYGAGIPVLFFFTGLHEHYHAPSDTADTLNAPGAARVVSLVQSIALAAATRRENFVYNGDAESQPSAAMGDRASAPRTRVRFGITPGDYAGEDGILVGDVSEGGSAAEAGIRKDDRLIKWNGESISTVQSWMPLLSKHEPGDKVEIVLVRDGQEVTVTATLKSRRTSNQ